MRILSYNIHALAPFIAGDNPRERINNITKLVDSYDVIFFQENWIFSNEEIAEKLPDYNIISSSHSKFYWPLSTVINNNGSGLTTAVRKTIDIVYDDESRYSSCSGWLSNSNDCLATKGLLFVRAKWNGQQLDLYNTHLDAGNSKADREARASQIRHIKDYIHSKSQGYAIIVAGDFNVNFYSQEVEVLNKFSKDLDIIMFDWSQTSEVHREMLDYVMYRESDALGFDFIGYGVDANLDNLSDHPAIRLYLDVRASN